MRFLTNSPLGENGGRPDADVLAIPEINSLSSTCAGAAVRRAPPYVIYQRDERKRDREERSGRMKEIERG